MQSFARISVIITLLGGPAMAGDCFVGQRFIQHGHVAHSYGHAQAVKVVDHTPHIKVINNVVGVPVPVPYQHLVAKQGATVFGYSNVVGNYADVDLALLFDKAERLASQAQSLSQTATTEYSTLVSSYAGNRANSADIQAAAQAIALVLSQRQQAGATFQATVATQVASDWQGVLATRCASCHDKYDGSRELSDGEWDAVFERITHAEPKKRMPLAADKASAGDPLTVGELKLLFQAN